MLPTNAISEVLGVIILLFSRLFVYKVCHVHDILLS